MGDLPSKVTKNSFSTEDTDLFFRLPFWLIAQRDPNISVEPVDKAHLLHHLPLNIGLIHQEGPAKLLTRGMEDLQRLGDR